MAFGKIHKSLYRQFEITAKIMKAFNDKAFMKTNNIS